LFAFFFVDGTEEGDIFCSSDDAGAAETEEVEVVEVVAAVAASAIGGPGNAGGGSSFETVSNEASWLDMETETFD
jgi:hypothetical protein